jgi:hypothetical protein
LDIRNNSVFNWQDRTTDGGAARVQSVNYYDRTGPATRTFHLIRPELEWGHQYGPQLYCISVDVMEGHRNATERLGGVKFWKETPLDQYIKDEPFFLHTLQRILQSKRGMLCWLILDAICQDLMSTTAA